MKLKMPWFWEYSDFSALIEPKVHDWKAFFIWLDVHTTPKLGARGPLLGFANRRRVYNTVSQLRDDYFHLQELRPLEQPDVAMSFARGCAQSFFPIGRTSSASNRVLFAHGWREIQNEEFFFEMFTTTVNDHEHMGGFGVVIGGSRRIWGVDGTTDRRLRKYAKWVSAEYWISKLGFHVSLDGGSEGGVTAARVTGITVRGMAIAIAIATCLFGRKQTNMVGPTFSSRLYWGPRKYMDLCIVLEARSQAARRDGSRPRPGTPLLA